MMCTFRICLLRVTEWPEGELSTWTVENAVFGKRRDAEAARVLAGKTPFPPPEAFRPLNEAELKKNELLNNRDE